MTEAPLILYACFDADCIWVTVDRTKALEHVAKTDHWCVTYRREV
jgi:hypothetical protein